MGFYNNPFSIKPASYNYSVEGYGDIISQVDNGIIQNKVIVIEGDYGTGKTSILKSIINHYKGQKRVCYLSCNRVKRELNVIELLEGRYGFWGRLFGIKGKDMILLLDEAYELTRDDFSKLQKYIKKNIRAVILTTDSSSRLLMDVNKNDENLIMISLNKLPGPTAIDIIRKRIGNLHIIDDDTLIYIFEKSDHNPRIYLENCEDVFKYAAENKITKITSPDVDKVL